MSAPLNAIGLLLIGFGRKEPEFGSYAGQLGTGHGVRPGLERKESTGKKGKTLLTHTGLLMEGVQIGSC
jgi:hypothetical protein